MKTIDLVQDIRGYGKLLLAWKGTAELWRDAAATGAHKPADPRVVRAYLEEVYGLIEVERPLTVYRFAERRDQSEQPSRAPYGQRHISTTSGRAARRKPSAVAGPWWSPLRPSLLIDHLGYGSEHSVDLRNQLAILKEWNRFDLCVEGTVQPFSLVYAGRVAPQAEDAAFDGDGVQYPGGAMQFCAVRGGTAVHVTKLHRIGTRQIENVVLHLAL